MKINQLRLTNFGGVEGTQDYVIPTGVSTLIGKNGTGKTTFLNGLRFALTGAEPEGSCIFDKADSCTVAIVVEDGDGERYEFTRSKYRDGKPSKVEINGYATTQKAMNQKMAAITGVPVDSIRVVSSAELVAAMKPQEFASFILGYIPEKLLRTEIISFIPCTTAGMIQIIESLLPEEEIDLSIIEAFDVTLRNRRKDLKQDIVRKKTLLETLPKTAPTDDEASLKAKMEQLDNIAAAKKVYAEKKAMYDRAVEAQRRCTENIARTEKELATITATRPDPNELNVYTERLKELKLSNANQRTAIAGAFRAIEQLEKTLENLDKPICPISPLITCHEDKSTAKKEVSESLAASKAGLEALTDELTKTESALAETEHKIVLYNDNARQYEKKILLAKQINTMKDSMPVLPAVPAALPERMDVDIYASKQELNQKLLALSKYEEAKLLVQQLTTMADELADYEALVAAVAEKGPVRTNIITKYLSVLENLCNERSTKFAPDTKFQFESNGGIVIKMSNARHCYMTFDSLSGGERAYFLFILLDMINALVGSRLLILDELNVLDIDTLNALLNLVDHEKTDYDHIFLSSVNHKGIVDAMNAHSFPSIL